MIAQVSVLHAAISKDECKHIYKQTDEKKPNKQQTWFFTLMKLSITRMGGIN